MFQYIAQGACQALEDAVCLADALAHQAGDVRQAFLAYQRERIPRTAHVQRTARLFGDIIHSAGAEAQQRNETLAERADTDYSQMQRFYGYQPERS
jgi:salicylate hydroxylase